MEEKIYRYKVIKTSSEDTELMKEYKSYVVKERLPTLFSSRIISRFVKDKKYGNEEYCTLCKELGL